jgi:RimJ/RimL family protein N-acetyltransferase
MIEIFVQINWQLLVLRFGTEILKIPSWGRTKAPPQAQIAMTRSGVSDNRQAMETSEDLKFLPLSEEHIPLLWRWLEEPHVAEYWQEPDCRDQSQLQDKFLSKLPLRGVYPFILYVAGTPIGYFQYYEAQKVGGGWWPDASAGTIGIDQFIGDPKFIGRGLGTKAIRKFAQMILASTAAQEIITDPDPFNERAINTYKKCGFEPVGEITTPGGEALLMRFSVARELAR